MAGRRKRDPGASLMSALQAPSAAPTAAAPNDTPTATPTAPGIKLIERTYNAVREIDPDLIDDSVFADRLELFTIVKSAESLNADSDVDHQDATLEQLVDSILTHGQKVPILVRQSSKDKGRYEIIFGRRRLAAIRHIRSNPRPDMEDADTGLRIKANIETKAEGQTDKEFDNQALVTQALENAARKNLSPYEKARFANIIYAAGVEKQDVARMMNMSATNLSNLLKITRVVPDELGDLIGAASGSGRPKWEALANGLQSEVITVHEASKLLSDMDPSCTSDERLNALLAEIKSRSGKSTKREVRTLGDVAKVQKGPTGLKLTIADTKNTAGFADWLDVNIEAIIEDSLKRFKEENPGKN